jgi:type IV fimbrial biogenesis protein FimT
MRITRCIDGQAASGAGRNAERRPSKGFTMVELMMVVAILAIMSALAAPSMSKMIANQRLRSVATDLHLALVKARAEAIKRNADGVNTHVRVSPAGGSWTAGWSVDFVDENPNPDIHVELDVRGPTPSVSINSTATQVEYRGTGRTASAASAFVITSSSTDAARCLSIDSTGRPYVKEGSTC